MEALGETVDVALGEGEEEWEQQMPSCYIR